MKLTISQQEYEKLRQSGLSKEQIVARYSEKPTSLGKKILNAGTAVANFVGAGGISEQFGASLARTGLKTGVLQGGKEAAKYVQDPSLRRVVGSAIQTGANFIPGAGVGMNLAGKAAVGAATGYAFDVGANLQLERKGVDAFKPGIGTVVGTAFPVIGKIIGITLGRGTASASKKLEEINMRLTPTERNNLQKKGQDIAKYLSERKVVGSPAGRYAKVSNLYEEMERRIQNVIAKSKVTYPTSNIISELEKIPDAFVDDPELASEAITTVGRLISSLQSRGDTLSANAVNKLKRNYMRRAFAKNATDVLSESRLAIGAIFKKILDDSVPELTKINPEYGLVIASRRVLQKALSRPQVGLMGNLAGTAAATAIGNALLPGGGGAAAGALLGKPVSRVIAGTPVRSAIGAGLQTASQLVEKINKLPTDGLGNISKKAVLNYLEGLKSSQ